MILCLCPNPSVDKFIWIEELVKGKVNRIKKEDRFPGGKGVHVALGIAELGEKCALLGFWGGYAGNWIKQQCEEKGIRCYGPNVKDENRACLTFRSSRDMEGTELLGIGPYLEEEDIKEFWSEYLRLLEHSTAVCMSGSWPPAGSGIGYADYIKVANERSIKTFIDCSGDSLMNNLSSLPYCVHINKHEGLEVFNEESPLKIAGIVSDNCHLAAVTCGSDGLYLTDKNKVVIHANCEVSNIISAVGCGDALMAGLIVAQMRKMDIIDTAKFSVACGAANCIRKELGMFYNEDVEILKEQTEISFGDFELLLQPRQK